MSAPIVPAPAPLRRGISLITVAAGIGIAVVPAEAWATSGSEAGEPAHGEEILVTGSYTTNGELESGTSLGLTIRETPQSVTVLTAQRMEDQGIRSLSDVADNAAGVSTKSFDSARSGFSARGFAIDAYEIDGIPVQWEPAYSAGESQIDMALFESVEIVRGATGLLSGAGNPSASINLIRKHAQSRQLTATVSAGGGSRDRYFGMLDLSAPVTAGGDVRARGVVRYEEGDSFVDRLSDKRLVLYGVVDADIAPGTQLRFGASYQDNSPHGTQWGGLPVWFSDGTRTNWKRSKSVGANWTRWASTNESYFAQVTQAIGDNWSLKFYGNYSRNKSEMELLYLFGQVDKTTGLGLGAAPARYEGDLKQIDLGARLTGTYRLFGREHDLMLGASFARQTLDFDSFAADPTTIAEPGSFLDWDGSYPEPRWSGSAVRELDQRTKQWGYVAATRLSLTDQLKFIGGGRLSSWTRVGTAHGAPADYGDKNRFLPYAGLLYEMLPGHTFYASYSKIFHPQNHRDRSGVFLPPVTGENYEAGLKSSFFGGALNTAISVFRVEENNHAERDGGVLVPGTIDEAYRTADGARSEGFEVELNGEILPGWAVSANFTHFNAEDDHGKRVNTLFADKLLRVFSTYKFGGKFDGLTLGGGVNWEGKSYTDTVNPVTGGAERLVVRPHALVNLMARYELPVGLSLQLNIENLFDKTYYSQIGFYNQLAYGEPRRATATLRFRY